MTEHTPDDPPVPSPDPAPDQTPTGEPTPPGAPPPPPSYWPPPPDPAPPPPAYPPPPPPDPAAYPPPASPYPSAPGYPPAAPAYPAYPPPPPAYPPPAPAYPPPAQAYPPPPAYGSAPGYAPPGGHDSTGGYGPASGWGPPPPYGPPGYPPPGAPYGGYQAVPTDAFGRPLAEWWQRVVAAILDGLVLGIPLIIVIVIIVSATTTTIIDPVTGFGTTQTSDTASWLTNVVWVTATLLYFGVLDGRGQTVGKLALGIAVRSEATGHPIGVGRGMARRALYILLWAAFFIPGLLNALSPLWDRKRQAWHDHAVGSVVVKVR